jgi:hypothetical protein
LSRAFALRDLVERAMEMDEKTYCTISGVIFIIGALLHLGRLCAGWEFVIAGWAAPMWLSWIALGIAGTLGGLGLWLGARGTV